MSHVGVLPKNHNSTIQYSCVFSLDVGNESLDNARKHLLGLVRKWIATNRNVQTSAEFRSIGGDWFLERGNFGRGRTSVVVDSVTDAEPSDLPKYWALRFEHPDRDISFRQWRTDIGVTMLGPNIMCFALTVAYGMLPGYIGDAPPIPESGRPKLVGWIIDDEVWIPSSGSLVLSSQSEEVSSEVEARKLWGKITDNSRQSAIVLLMPNRDDSSLSMDHRKLAQMLTGIARVFHGAPDAYRSLKTVFPDEYICYAGYARIYQPHLRLEDARDSRRHRYFSGPQILELSPDKVQEIIYSSLARSTRLTGDVVASVDDIALRRREMRLNSLRKQGEFNEEYVRLLQEELQSLQEEKDDYKQQIPEYESAIEQLKFDNDELTDELSRARNSNLWATTQITQLKKKIDEQEQKLGALEKLSRLPSSLPEVIELVCRLQPGRLYFTPEANRSARDASYSNVPDAWECLWHMSTTLHALYFSSSSAGIDIANAFHRLSGFEIALSEGRMTNKDSKLRDLRQILFEGQLIDITPHVKIGNKEPNLLRIHYYADRQSQRIIIGHCGNHLDNRTTKMRT